MILDVMWFCGRSNVGIVRVKDEWDGIKYYIGSPPFMEYAPHNEDADKIWIAEWGSTFPRDVGDVLFGVDPLRDGSSVQIPVSKEQAQTMIAVGMSYLESRNEKE
jgi:hypothetical protein